MDTYKKVNVKLIKSTISSIQSHKATVEALGLKKVGQSKVHTLTPSIAGMLFKVKHLVSVTDAE